MKTSFYFFLFIGLLMFACKPQKTDKNEQIPLEKADSLLQASSLYEMEYEQFVSILDSVKQLIDKDEPEVAVKYYFKNKHYAYNLNHSLANFDTCITMYADYEKVTEDIDLASDSLLQNEYYKKFLLSYLDLKAKYKIAEGKSNYQDNIFIHTQFDIIKEELKGSIREFAAYKVLELQITTFGHEYTREMRNYFNKVCNNAEYKYQIDSLYAVHMEKLSMFEEHIYKIAGKDTLSAYVSQPENQTQPNPCIVIVHGGGWYQGHPMQRLQLPQAFNQFGVAAVCIEYRIKGRQNATPVDGLMDTKAALRWVRQEADRLGIDTSKVIVSGLSAGGHLAAATALISGYEYEDENKQISSVPDATILWSACIDPTLDSWFYYCLQGEVNPEDLSPTHHVQPTNIPFMLFQGTDDEFLDHQTHIDFCEKMNNAGNVCELNIFENLSHTQVYEQNMTTEFTEFLDKYIRNSKK